MDGLSSGVIGIQNKPRTFIQFSESITFSALQVPNLNFIIVSGNIYVHLLSNGYLVKQSNIIIKKFFKKKVKIKNNNNPFKH